MKKTLAILFSAALLSLAATSCQKEELEAVNHAWKASGNWSSNVFSASFSSDNGKTSMTDQYQIVWTPGDQIRIQNDAGQALNYNIVEINDDGTLSKFSVPQGSDELEGDYFTATYPTSFTGASITLPETQTYDATKHLVDFPMYAESPSHILQFHNLCGVLELTLQQANIRVKEIIVSTDQNITGNFSIGEEGEYKCVKAEGATGNNRTAVKLDCGNGVSISNATKFYIYLPVAEFTKFDIEVVTTSGATFTAKKNDNRAMPFQRNRVKTVSLNNLTFHKNPDNGVKGLYSVSANQRVYIAHGNLYYKLPCTHIVGFLYPRTVTDTAGYWGFYNNQWGHYHKDSQTNNSGDTLSFFPWGYTNSKTYDYAVDGEQDFVDWGGVSEVKSSTGIGRQARGIGEHWRTLTGQEWKYLLFERTMIFGAPRYAAIQLTYMEGTSRKVKNGILLYPDRYNPAQGRPLIENTPGQPNPGYNPSAEIDANNDPLLSPGTWKPVNWVQWQQLEAEGCAFLPADGYRQGTSVTTEANGETLHALYHSSTRRMDASELENFNRDIFGVRSVGALMGIKVPKNAQIGGNAFSCGHNVRLMMNEEYGPAESLSPIL